MTDNEKAATFIGWKPDQTCVYPTEHRRDDFYWDYLGEVQLAFCRHCRLPFEHRTAPDMRKPENYMKALVEVAAQGHLVVLTNKAWERHWAITISWHESASETATIERDGGSPSDVVIKALAAVYDAEGRQPPPPTVTR